MKNILHKFFHGQVNWSSQCSDTAKTKAITHKIESERLYFASIMSDENFKRFKKLEKLHRERNSVKYMETYINAFKTGAAIMCALFAGEDEHDDDEF